MLRFVKFLSPLLPRCNLGLLLRDSLSIAILAYLGSIVNKVNANGSAGALEYTEHEKCDTSGV